MNQARGIVRGESKVEKRSRLASAGSVTPSSGAAHGKLLLVSCRRGNKRVSAFVRSPLAKTISREMWAEITAPLDMRVGDGYTY